ncbi:hypothetical protein ACFZC5_36055 [Nocardia gamkensis]|uniref:hypothetical protein n=1 Tax=Nocardia gamkensis TaxID=352869 RepID=UPI0036E30671
MSDPTVEPELHQRVTKEMDSAMARILLGGVLSVTEADPVKLAWAVSVMRGPAGVGVFITSNEGRGWLPQGIFLPWRVSNPWIWDGIIGGDGNCVSLSWESVRDPVKVLIEFGAIFGPKADAMISALASSGPIDHDLMAQNGDIATAEFVEPCNEFDLRISAADTVDRLGLAGSIDSLKYVAQVRDDEVSACCTALTVDAHRRLSRSTSRSEGSDASRFIREEILHTIQRGGIVSSQLWDNLQAADEILAHHAHQLLKSDDASHREEGAPDDLRRVAVFERRCNEQVLLLAKEPTRQLLRDIVYAHDQILQHPLCGKVLAADT